MKIERKDEFGDIGVAKIYREGESAPYKTLIHGGTKHFDNIDFAEYDFNVILENHKFNSKDLISYLDKETSKKIGTDLGSLEKINSVLFPTLSNGDVNDVEYFNTLSISAVTLYLFNLDPGVNKVELYESFSEDTSEDDWVVMITLGVSSKWKKDLTIVKSDTAKEVPTRNDLWQGEHGSDVRIPGINEAWWVTDEGCAYVYKEDSVVDEINCGKAVWLALTTDNTVKDVNLSYYAWLQSEDANIYKHKFNLRNDDYYDKTKSEFLVSNNFSYTDRRSGKLLGNQLIVASDNSSCPILSRKLKDVKNRWSAGDVEYSNYDPEIEYRLGDLVILNGIIYKSVRKNNRGHFPGISSYWALKSSIDNIKTTRVTLLNYQKLDDSYSINMEAGITSPNKQITLDENSNAPGFKVIDNSGYKFASICYENASGTIITLNQNDYVVDRVISSSTGDVVYYRVIIKPDGWNVILGDNSRKRLIFAFEVLESAGESGNEASEHQELVKINVEDYNGFEVDKTNFSVQYNNNTAVTIQFYGSYKDSLSSIDIYYDGIEEPKQLLTPSDTWDDFGNFAARYNKDSITKMYTLELKGIQKDLTIKLIQQ